MTPARHAARRQIQHVAQALLNLDQHARREAIPAFIRLVELVESGAQRLDRRRGAEDDPRSPRVPAT